MRSLLTLCLIAAALTAGAAQTAREQAAQGVAVAVRSSDDMERAWGLRNEELRDAAEQGVRAASWSVNEHSGRQISVEITTLAQQDEDLFPLRLTVRGSRSAADADTAGEFPPEVTASRIIQVPWADHARILATVKNMSASVARKMKADLLRRNY